MKKIFIFLGCIIGVIVLCFLIAGITKKETIENIERVYSYDNNYAIEVSIIQKEDARYMKIDIYDLKSDKIIYSIDEYRLSDFKGVAWEENSNNFWIRSADVGTFCYIFSDEGWEKYYYE